MNNTKAKAQAEQRSPSSLHPVREQEDLLVWDQQGIVIVWADGHRSRFSWPDLRAICTCEACQQYHRSTTPLARNAA